METDLKTDTGADMETEMETDGPPPQVWPTLRARDARALITFLCDAFGFEETVVYGDGDQVDHAQLSWPLGGGIMLGSARETDEDAWPLRPGTFGATWSPTILTVSTTGPSKRAPRSPPASTRPTTALATSPLGTSRAIAGHSAPTGGNLVANRKETEGMDAERMDVASKSTGGRTGSEGWPSKPARVKAEVEQS
jgi:hypothetical protein